MSAGPARRRHRNLPSRRAWRAGKDELKVAPISVMAPSETANPAPGLPSFIGLFQNSAYAPPRGSADHARKFRRENSFRLARDASDDLAGRQDVVDQTDVLSHRQWRFVGVAPLARVLDLGERRGLVLPQRPFAPCPALDEAISLRARHGAGPDFSCRDVWNFGKEGIVTIALDDRLLEVGVKRRFHAGEKSGTEQDTIRTKRQGGHKASSIGDAAGGIADG